MSRRSLESEKQAGDADDPASGFVLTELDADALEFVGQRLDRRGPEDVVLLDEFAGGNAAQGVHRLDADLLGDVVEGVGETVVAHVVLGLVVTGEHDRPVPRQG